MVNNLRSFERSELERKIKILKRSQKGNKPYQQTRMVKDREDQHRFQTTNLKLLG